MKIQTNDLQRFVGGQIEIQDLGEGYLFRGEIASIEIKSEEKTPLLEGLDNYGDLVVQLNWYAKMENASAGWKVSDEKTYTASLPIYSVTSIGQNRLILLGTYTREVVTLFPKGGSALDPKKVAGLKLES